MKRYKLNKKIVSVILTIFFVLISGMTSFAASVAPTEYSGNDNNSYSPPSGYTHVSFDGNDTEGTYSKAIGEYTFTCTLAGSPLIMTKWWITTSDSTLYPLSNFKIYSVIIKGSNAYNEYVYNNGTTSDTNLVAPGSHDVSHTSFVYKIVEPEYGSLKIVKTLSGDTPSSAATFTFDITGPGGYSNSVTISGANSQTLTNLEPGDYTVIERVSAIPTNYTVTSTNPQSTTVVAGQTKTLTFNNEYDDHKGSLKITKTLSGDSPSSAADFTFDITGPGGYTKTVTISGANSKTLTGLELGNYTVTEKVSAIPVNYTVTSTNPQTVTVYDDQTAEVTFNNKYDDQKGALKIIKTLSGDTPSSAADFTFDITGPGEYTNSVTITGKGSKTLSNLELGDYTVTERESAIPTNYTVTSTNPQTVEVFDDETAEVTFDNEYDAQKGSLKIIKTLSGDTPSSDATFTFDIAGPDNYSNTVTIIGADSKTLSNLELGDYTVTERQSAIPSYYKVTSTNPQTVEVFDDETAEVTFDNSYDEQKGALKIIKTLSGDTPSSDATFTFDITGPDNYSNTVTIIGADSKTLSNLELGDYTVTERESAIPAYYTVTSTNPQTVEVFDDETAEVTFDNEYDAHCSLTINKRNSYGNPIFGLSFTFRLEKVGDTWTSEKSSTNGVITWEDLEPAEYKLIEVNAPEGFYYDAQPDNVTLVDGDKKTVNVKNYEYVTVYAMKRDILTKQVLAGAEFAIFNTLNGDPTTQIGATQISGPDGIVVFGKEYQLKANVLYWVKEINPPTGYQNDPATATGYSVMIGSFGGSNEGDPVIFENTPLLGSIVVAKFREGNTSVRLQGVVFSLYKGSVSDANLVSTIRTDSNGNAVWDNLIPGTYVLVEDSTITGYQILTKTQNVVLNNAQRKVVLVYNRQITTPTPTPTTPDTPETTPTPTPSPTPTPTATPTPITTDELIIDDVDPAFGPETGEGDVLFISIGIMLILGTGLFILRKRLMLKK